MAAVGSASRSATGESKGMSFRAALLKNDAAHLRFRGKFIVIGAVALLGLILLLRLVWKPR
jgi:hypothetical protein